MIFYLSNINYSLHLIRHCVEPVSLIFEIILTHAIFAALGTVKHELWYGRQKDSAGGQAIVAESIHNRVQLIPGVDETGGGNSGASLTKSHN